MSYACFGEKCCCQPSGSGLFRSVPELLKTTVSRIGQSGRGSKPTIYVEDVIVVGLPNGIGCHAAIGAVVGLIEVLDVQVRARDHSVRRNVLIHSQPVDLVGAGENKYHTHQSAAVYLGWKSEIKVRSRGGFFSPLEEHRIDPV